MIVQEKLAVRERSSVQGKLGGLIISAPTVYVAAVDLVVGRPGQPNVEKTLGVGGAVLFETPDQGIFEVRVLETTSVQASLLVSQISPISGIAGGFVDQDTSNSPFSSAERMQIADSLQRIYRLMSERQDVSPEQLDLISRKLDDIKAASERLGRKDWINLALGTLTSLVVTAAFEPHVAKALFQTADAALSWLFGSNLRLL